MIERVIAIRPVPGAYCAITVSTAKNIVCNIELSEAEFIALLNDMIAWDLTRARSEAS